MAVQNQTGCVRKVNLPKFRRHGTKGKGSNPWDSAALLPQWQSSTARNSPRYIARAVSPPDYTTGYLNFVPHTGLNKFLVNLKTLIAWICPARYLSSIYGLPQICENLLKAAYDPRISAVEIINFRKSGKLIVAYVAVMGGKEYYIGCACEEVYTSDTPVLVSLFKDRLNPESVTLGKYKGAGPALGHRPRVRRPRAHERPCKGVGGQLIEDYHETKTINRRIIGQDFINKIREAGESKKFKAVIIRIDSLGGDILFYSLMWTKIRSLASKKPVIALMSDLAMSAGYYMAMGAGVIVAENLTLTGSIGVDLGKFIPENENINEKIDLEEYPDDGRYHKLHAAKQQGSSRPFSKSRMYKQFRDDVDLSRSMTVDKMEEVAQRRIWTGKDAVSNGLVDAISGLSRAIAIAKLKANLPQNRHVTIVELSYSSCGLKAGTSGIGAETARVLAKRGVRIVIGARDLKKAMKVRQYTKRESKSLDLPLNILINNAGIFSQVLEFSAEKIEMTFATNYLDTFLIFNS
ncbi:S49 protease IV family peptidase [Medicago truncatula]|uniref:S49 protease IV family peptidase n=1 Tax=Medicago truncatula TaxID=3880 RepID=G7L8E8_MEDTR|nr:S49 protease IV family peptidase [Medicago truncatula]